MLFAFNCDTEWQILFPQISSESVLMHGPVPEFNDSFNN